MAHLKTSAFSSAESQITFLDLSVDRGNEDVGLLEALSECDKKVGLENIVRQTVFLPRSLDRRHIEAALSEGYGPSRPVTTFAYQPPADGQGLALEAWALPGAENIERREHVIIASQGGTSWAFLGGLEIAGDGDLREAGARILKRAQEELARSGVDFRSVIRTWCYIGGILAVEDGTSRYDKFNWARNAAYRDKWPDLRLSPASTGIGMETNRVAVEGIAVQGDPITSSVTWIDNPLQESPYCYEIDVDPEHHPSFSRATAVSRPDSVMLFVSGTASIRGSAVIHPDDPEAQTDVTIENLLTLIGSENLVGNYRLPRGATPQDIFQFRVYIKNPEDLEVVLASCRRHLPDVPQVCLVAEICRPECLVEIEAVAAFTCDAPG